MSKLRAAFAVLKHLSEGNRDGPHISAARRFNSGEDNLKHPAQNHWHEVLTSRQINQIDSLDTGVPGRIDWT
jgi:hypothetical protein